MIIYENEKYIVTQHCKLKHIIIYKKNSANWFKGDGVEMIYHASVDEKAPIMTKKEGENYLLGVLKFLEEL